MQKRPIVAALVTVGVAAYLVVTQGPRDVPAGTGAAPTLAPTATGGKVSRPMISSPTAPTAPAAERDTRPPADPASRDLPPVAAAIADFASQTKVDAAAVTVRRLERVTWPDGSLGCPKPGMMYTQALVDGYWLELAGGGRDAEYHTDLEGRTVSCRSGPPTDNTR